MAGVAVRVSHVRQTGTNFNFRMITAASTAFLLVYLLGVVLNAAVSLALLCCPDQLASVLNRPVAGLVFVCFLWCLQRVILYAVLLSTSEAQSNVVAALSSLMVFAILLLNAVLGAERYFVLTPHRRRHFYYGTGVLTIAAVCSIMWSFSTSPTTDMVRPDKILQLKVWVATAVVVFVYTVVACAFFYGNAYAFTVSKLSNSMHVLKDLVANGSANGDSESVNELSALESAREKLERTMLYQCIWLSCSVLVCYLPIMVYVTVNLAYTSARGMEDISVDGSPTSAAWYASAALMALDPLITPCVVVFFKRDLLYYLLESVSAFLPCLKA
ncbi:hypothetical protein HDU83_008097 [Entophlyctis luteolus]|nr:hypothetical protein HDU83_008097 [Entophlyctis luteolus]KAJ3394407.1 hypothetical protein HDU84_008403 [Entophlyctis sp. JEL0112]